MTIVAIILGVVAAVAIAGLIVWFLETRQLERNKQAARTVTRAFNTGQVELIDEAIHGNVQDTGNRKIGINAGFDGVKRQIVMLRQQFPDLKFEEDMIVAERDRVILRWKMTGTNTGEIFGRKPTNRRITHHGTEFVRCKNGKIVEHSDAADIMRLLDKLGLLDEAMLTMLTDSGIRKYPI
jgi:predicted ester cyclase